MLEGEFTEGPANDEAPARSLTPAHSRARTESARVPVAHLLQAVVTSRRAARRLRHTPLHAAMLCLEADLAAALPPAVSRTTAAATLGVTRHALALWIARGAVPVAGPGRGAAAGVPTPFLLDLLGRVAVQRGRGRRGRPRAKALRDLAPPS